MASDGQPTDLVIDPNIPSVTEVVPPGLVPAGDWHPDAGFFEPDPSRTGFLGGVGRVR